MKLIYLTLLLVSISTAEGGSETAKHASLTNSYRCEELEAAVYDASRDGTEELTEDQFCSAYSDDSNCIELKQLNCEVI